MQVEAAKAELRSRSPFEAADLGLLLLRTLWGPACWAWLGFVLPVQLAVLLLCPGAPGLWAYLAVWWLKPLYDRAFGLVVGRGLFGEPPRLRALYRALWREGKRGLIADLLWRRFDPARTLVLAVTLLEGLRSRQATRRRQTVAQGSTKAALQLLASCVALELSTAVGLFVGALLLMPEEAKFIAEDALALSWDDFLLRVAGAAYVLAVGLVEPLFVAAGFGLYVNRRTDLEGWDVELTFRRMARRLAPAVVVVAGLLASSFAGGVTQVAAQPEHESTTSALDEPHRLPAPALNDDGAAAQRMARVLARPELERSHVEERWVLRNQADDSGDPKPPPAWLIALANALAQGAEIVIWILAVLALAVLIFLLVERARRAQFRADSRAESAGRPAVVTRVELAPRALALEQVVPTARALLASGRNAAALSALYIGTLNALRAQDGLDVPAQATEGQCLAAVQAAPIAEGHRALFSELTSHWQLAAYAHVPIGERAFEALCTRFGSCFGVGS